LFFARANYAQFDFEKDSSRYAPCSDWLNKRDGVYHLSDDDDFEVLVWIYPIRAYWPILCTLAFKHTHWNTVF
jgi:hypothetical protein